MRTNWIIWLLLLNIPGFAQERFQSEVWVADMGNDTYRNPILHADYSDPDAIRVGDDYFMISSSFEDVPGIPILHSRDLVNWQLIGYALDKLRPYDHFTKTRHGQGVWAPSIRYHNKKFYIYYPDPDFGIYMICAENASGPWSEPTLVESGRGLIDPCPLWDDDGKAYLVHAFAGSRSGMKSILVIKPMNPEGTQTTGEGVMVYDGHGIDPTVEGPKLYKQDGYYYIFAPAGGVTYGWQLVLRSKNIYGPYERKIVLEQGSTEINGPHQGAWVSTQTGEDWFIHFQDKEAYGRIVHLQPMKWKDGWPVMGNDADGDGKGEPVLRYRKPSTGASDQGIITPPDTDEFNTAEMGLQWQRMANPNRQNTFLQPSRGSLVMFSQMLPDSASNLFYSPDVLLQKFPAEEFMITTKMKFNAGTKVHTERTGLVVMGLDYAFIGLRKQNDKMQVVFTICRDADKQNKETEEVVADVKDSVFYFRVKLVKGAVCRFSYSTDGINFRDAGREFRARPGKWKGAKAGLFCTRNSETNDSGFAEIDWFRVQPIR